MAEVETVFNWIVMLFTCVLMHYCISSRFYMTCALPCCCDWVSCNMLCVYVWVCVG